MRVDKMLHPTVHSKPFVPRIHFMFDTNVSWKKIDMFNGPCSLFTFTVNTIDLIGFLRSNLNPKILFAKQFIHHMLICR